MFYFFASFQTAFAQNFVIDSRNAPYNSVAVAQNITIHSGVDLRVAALLGLVGAANALSGPFSPVIRVGDRFTVIYSDGSKEDGVRLCLSGTPCVAPIPGTQQEANDSGFDGGGGGLTDGSGFDGGGIFAPIVSPYPTIGGGINTGVVSIGEIIVP